MADTGDTNTVQSSELPLHLLHRGKVRDNYDMGNSILMVTTDRVSAFDVVLPGTIPDKGRVLAGLSAFWFEKTRHIIRNHLLLLVKEAAQLRELFPPEATPPDYLAGRTLLVKTARRLPVEWVVRGYLSGSAWEEYSQTGRVGEHSLPPGLKESQELPSLLFTPTTKEDEGHDMPLTQVELNKLIGEGIASRLKETSLAVYRFAHEFALERDIIIADTKMEFGLDGDEPILIDELLTPDSSRFWDRAAYQPGRSQPSFDKQPLRDWLVVQGWNKEPPAPQLDAEVVALTTQRYREAYNRLTGQVL
ncbi:MAG: phosphoribosylaminoimidazolesuccinocarboxamide synthase [Dehalococcoidia bacterium]|nr:phosphoribosylaminoimidazolesuccinocarboxamide synthase [Dehalococcoidia bacterium]